MSRNDRPLFRFNIASQVLDGNSGTVGSWVTGGGDASGSRRIMASSFSNAESSGQRLRISFINIHCISS